jgi:hypothetical protein
MVWLEQPGPDPWMWQRLVGLLATSAQPHPEAPCGPLVDLADLPWAEEVRWGEVRHSNLSVWYCMFDGAA